MSDPKGYDYLDIGTPTLANKKGASAHLATPLLVLFASLACVGAFYYTVHNVLIRRAGVGETEATGQSSPDDLVKRQLTAFIDRFLPAYYNFSYTLYTQSVNRAEAMMTPAFQAAYNQRSEDLDFKRKLDSLKVSTNAIKILQGSMAFSNDGSLYYARLAGTMTYTTGINGVSGDFPITLLLAIRKTNQGFLVDNVERIR